jgi:diketogulonate reductase-like aldo/keto reductase
MDYVTLSNGIKAPLLGIGTFMIKPEDTAGSVYTALKDGYRMIDTANAYGNEVEVGQGLARAIEEGIVTREEVFLSTKLWPTLYENDQAVDQTLERLGVDYVDLLFIHQPAGNFLAGYHQLEKAYKEGKTKSIGISNMYGEKLDTLLKNAEIKPHVVQLEAHPYCSEKEYMAKMKEYGTVLEGWYPLGHGDPGLQKEPVFVKLADKYHKTPAQVILRWGVQMKIMTIPGSKNPDHIRDNGNIFDFSLTEEEMAEIAKLDGTKKYYNPTKEDEEKYADMHLPFEGK